MNKVYDLFFVKGDTLAELVKLPEFPKAYSMAKWVKVFSGTHHLAKICLWAHHNI